MFICSRVSLLLLILIVCAGGCAGFDDGVTSNNEAVPRTESVAKVLFNVRMGEKVRLYFEDGRQASGYLEEWSYSEVVLRSTGFNGITRTAYSFDAIMEAEVFVPKPSSGRIRY